MPIQLTTQLNSGDMSVDVYDHVKIMRQTHDARRSHIILDLDYGTITDGEFISGSVAPYSDNLPNSVVISGTDYIVMVTTHVSNTDEVTYEAVKRGLYEYLQANYPSLAGTII